MLSVLDAERLIAGLEELHSLGPVEAFAARALRISRGLIGCDDATFNEIELETGAYRVLVDPDDNATAAVGPAFAEYVHQHPVIAHVAVIGEQIPHAISDFLRRASSTAWPCTASSSGHSGSRTSSRPRCRSSPADGS